MHCVHAFFTLYLVLKFLYVTTYVVSVIISISTLLTKPVPNLDSDKSVLQYNINISAF